MTEPHEWTREAQKYKQGGGGAVQTHYSHLYKYMYKLAAIDQIIVFDS